MSEKLTKISVNMFVFSGRNPRYEMRGLEELASNIEQYGVLQPVIARPKGNRFEVVVGERRLRAAIMAGLKEVPAIVRDISNREADEVRLVENIHRDDLTDAEKGDAVYALIENYPEKHKSVADVARALSIPYKTVLEHWCRKSRKLSPYLRELISSDLIKDHHAVYLLKYDYTTQDKLADVIINNEIPSTMMSKFIKLYDENPEANLGDLANQAKKVKKVEVEVTKLPPEARKEVERIVEERKEEVKRAREEATRKAAKAPRRPKPKLVQNKLPVPTPPVEVPPLEEVKPKPIAEGLRELLEKDIEELKRESFIAREEAFKRIRKVLEEPIPAREERRMIKEVDTGIIQECPVCHKKFRIIHYEPPNGHKCEEVSE